MCSPGSSPAIQFSCNFSLVDNSADGNCLLYSLIVGLDRISKLGLRAPFMGDILSFRSEICGWALNNPYYAISDSCNLFQLVVSEARLLNNIPESIDDDCIYRGFWLESIIDKFYCTDCMIFAAAGFLKVDIHTWISAVGHHSNLRAPESKIVLHQSSFCSSDPATSKPQIHILWSGGLGRFGHYRFVESYRYKFNKQPMGMDSIRGEFDLRFQDSGTILPPRRIPRNPILPIAPALSLPSTPVSLSPPPTAADVCTIRLKGVTGFNPVIKPLFQRVLILVIKKINAAIQDLSNQLTSNTVWLDNAIAAFLFLPSICLNSAGKISQAKTISLILDRFLASPCIIAAILEERNSFFSCFKSSSAAGSSGKKILQNSANKIPAYVLNKISEFIKIGRVGKAAEVLLSSYTASTPAVIDSNGSILNEIQDKFNLLHPIGSPFQPSSSSEAPFSITLDTLSETIAQLPLKSCNGLSSWTNDLLRFLCKPNRVTNDGALNVDFSSDILEELLILLNALCQGKGGSSKNWINSFFFFILKLDKNLRPIAVDDIFIRLLGRCVSKSRSHDIGCAISSVQLGVGVKGGCEFIVHTVTNWALEILSSNSSNSIIVQIDISNAFNSISRESIKSGILKYCPDLLALFNWSYGECTNLVLLNGSIIGQSSSGVRQGDPLGPLFFCLGLMEPLLATKNAFKDVDFLSYLDDGFLHGEKIQTLTAFQFLKHELTKVNLSIKESKSVIFCSNPAELSVLAASLGFHNVKISNEGLVVLGCPIGTAKFTNNELTKHFNDLQKYLVILKNVDPQFAFILLKYCLNTKSNYLARVCRPWLVKSFFKSFDNSVDSLIAFWAKTDSLTSVASLMRGISMGLGVPRIASICIPAYVASYSVALYKGKTSYSTEWNWTLNEGDAQLLEHSSHLSPYLPGFSFRGYNGEVRNQKDLSSIVESATVQDIASQLVNFPAKLSYFKSALQNKAIWTYWPLFCGNSPGIRFDCTYFSISIILRLLMDVSPPTLVGIRCYCTRQGRPVIIGDPIDQLHCFDCNNVAANRIERHDFVYKEILLLIRRYIPHASVEAEHLIRYANAEDKKADLKICLPNSQIFYVDVTIFNPGSRSYQNLSPEALMKTRERSKREQYKKVGFDLTDPSMIPFVIDVTGNIGPSGLAFIDTLHSFAKEKCPLFKQIFLRRINVALAHGLAKTILSFNDCLSFASSRNLDVPPVSANSFSPPKVINKEDYPKVINKDYLHTEDSSDDEGGGLEVLLGYVGRK